MSVSLKIKKLLKDNKIKQIKLAEYLKISPSRLSNYLSGKRDMSLDMLAKVAQYLSVDLNYFSRIYFESEPKSAICDDNMVAESDYHGICMIKAKNITERVKGIDEVIAFDSKFFNITDTSALFCVDVGNPYFAIGTYLVCTKISDNIQNGMYIVIPGRNAKFFKYIKSDSFELLMYNDNAEAFEKSRVRSGYVVNYTINPSISKFLKKSH